MIWLSPQNSLDTERLAARQEITDVPEDADVRVCWKCAPACDTANDSGDAGKKT